MNELEADELKIKQVVVNLLSNAVKFTGDGGTVDLQARNLGDRLELTVSDNGVGIDRSDQDRIFEEFQQAGRREGSGLGLALARRFVLLHGGTIAVESEPGVGSTFTVILPLRQPAPDGSPAPSGSAAPRPTETVR